MVATGGNDSLLQRIREQTAIERTRKQVTAANAQMTASFRTTLDGASQLTRSFGMLAASSEKDLAKVEKSLAKVEAAIQMMQGIHNIIDGATRAWQAYRTAAAAAAAVQVGTTAVGAAGSAAAGAAGGGIGRTIAGTVGTGVTGAVGGAAATKVTAAGVTAAGGLAVTLGAIAAFAASAGVNLKLLSETILGTTQKTNSWTMSIANAEVATVDWIARLFGAGFLGKDKTNRATKDNAERVTFAAEAERMAQERVNRTSPLKDRHLDLQMQMQRDAAMAGATTPDKILAAQERGIQNNLRTVELEIVKETANLESRTSAEQQAAHERLLKLEEMRMALVRERKQTELQRLNEQLQKETEIDKHIFDRYKAANDQRTALEKEKTSADERAGQMSPSEWRKVERLLKKGEAGGTYTRSELNFMRQSGVGNLEDDARKQDEALGRKRRGGVEHRTERDLHRQINDADSDIRRAENEAAQRNEEGTTQRLQEKAKQIGMGAGKGIVEELAPMLKAAMEEVHAEIVNGVGGALAHRQAKADKDRAARDAMHEAMF